MHARPLPKTNYSVAVSIYLVTFLMSRSHYFKTAYQLTAKIKLAAAIVSELMLHSVLLVG